MKSDYESLPAGNQPANEAVIEFLGVWLRSSFKTIDVQADGITFSSEGPEIEVLGDPDGYVP